MRMSEITRKKLLQVPKRKWDEVLENVCSVYVLPNGKKHDSGYECMDFVATFRDGRDMVRFGGWCDAIEFDGFRFQMDCVYPSGIIQISSSRSFSVSHDASTIWFKED